MFPFRYKLALLIGALALLMLGGTLTVVNQRLTAQLDARVRTNLVQTEEVVALLMDQRRQALADYGTSLAGDELLLDVVRDETLDRVTRDDIVTSEVLPSFPVLDLLAITAADGRALASNPRFGELADKLARQPFAADALDGERVYAAIFDGGACLQVAGIPVFLGEEMAAIIFVGMILDASFAQTVKDITRVEIAFVHDRRIFLATDWDAPDAATRERIRTGFDRRLGSRSDDDPRYAALRLRFHDDEVAGNRFVHKIKVDPAGFVPDYLVAKSLKNELRFVARLRNLTLLIGGAAALIALLFGFLLSMGVSRPVTVLMQGMEQVHKGDLSHEINIRSRDEFSRLGSAFNSMIRGLADKERIRGLINKVVSREIADEMLSGDIQLGGEEKRATMMFADIRGFTGMSEGQRPQDLLTLLNQYFTRMSACIDRHHGVIDKYIGDEIMALFGVPVATGDDAGNAVRAACEMMAALAAFNADNALARPIGIGIGINTGVIVAGNMGADDRLNYSVLGDDVNLAARLQGLTRLYETMIIISEATRGELGDAGPGADLVYRHLDTVQVKGKSTGTAIYDLPNALAGNGMPADAHERFEEGRRLLLARDFPAAENAFAALLAAWPTDGPTRVMLERCRLYQRESAAFDRDYVDGVLVLKEK